MEIPAAVPGPGLAMRHTNRASWGPSPQNNNLEPLHNYLHNERAPVDVNCDQWVLGKAAQTLSGSTS